MKGSKIKPIHLIEGRTNRYIILFVLGILCLFNTHAFAETYNIEGSGMYIAGASESLNDAKKHALEEAMRQVVEKAGVMVTSYSEMHNAELTKDETTVVASKIIKIKNKSFNTILISDSEIKVIASINAVINTDDINLNEIVKNNKNLENQYNQLKSENEYSKEKIKAQEAYNKLSDSINTKYYRNENVISKSYYNFLKKEYEYKKKNQVPPNLIESMFKRCMYDHSYYEAELLAEECAFDSYSPVYISHYALMQAEACIRNDDPTMALRLLNDVKRVIPMDLQSKCNSS